MAKVFYTERDIEDLARQGVNSLTVTDEVVVTDLAREKARKLGITLVNERDSRPSSAPARPYISEIVSPVAQQQPSAPAPPKPAAPVERPAASEGDLETRIFNSVKAKLGDQVDDTLLRTIVQRVLKSLGR